MRSSIRFLWSFKNVVERFMDGKKGKKSFIQER
jgi:hypothetical protein